MKKLLTKQNFKYMSNPHLIIEGDSTIVLEGLSSKYKQKISCIYIDPPYNNGEVYNFYSDNANKDTWLCSMKKIITQLKELLTEDGSIWISIDDGNMPYLKILCDDIFGQKNFIGTIIWQQRNTRENRKIFSNNHEYIIVYSPNPNEFKKKRNLLPITSDIQKRYKNLDNDPRGPWQSVSLNVQDGHAVKSQFYEIVAPNGKKHVPPKGRCWAYNQTKMKEEIRKNNIWFGKDGNSVPRLKKFMSNSIKGVVPETIWLSSFAGTNKDAKTHLKNLKIYNEAIFDTPKPESLIERIFEISTNEGDIVLDAFLGSGTTATVAHKMNRNYIGIEKNCISCSYIKNRLDQVIAGEKGGISKDISWAGGGEYDYIKW